MKKPILYSLFIFLIFSCGGGDDGPPTDDGPTGSDNGGDTIETFTVNSLKREFLPFEVADIEVDIALSNESYNGTFNDSEIILFKNEEGNLSFLVPELPVGSYPIKVFVDEKEGTSAISILELKEIENVETFLEEKLLSVVDEGISIGNSSSDVNNQELINEGLSYLNQFNQEFLNLTDEQKRILAHFLENNQIALSGLFNETNGGTGKGFDWDSQIQPMVNTLLISKSALVVLIGGIVVATYGGQPLLGLALVGLATIKYYKVINTRASILDAITIPILNDLNQINGKFQEGKSPDLTFINDGAKDFGVTSKGRGLIKGDLNHPNQKVVNAISTINESDKAITDLQHKVQRLIDLVGSFFTGRENKIERLGELPESAAEEIISVALKNFFIDDLPSDIDVSVVALDANTLQIKFTSATNEPTQFTANFIYDDGDFRTETALNVNLEINEENYEVDLTGYWRFIENGSPTGTDTSYDPGGEVINVISPPLAAFLESIRFDSEGNVSITGYPDTVTYNQSDSNLTLDVTYDRGNFTDIYSFSGSWDKEKNLYLGSGTRNFTQWYTSERMRLSVETIANFQLTLSR